MARYIDADKLPIKVWNGDFVGVSKNDMEQIPTEDVMPIVRGKWEYLKNKGYRCPVCQYISDKLTENVGTHQQEVGTKSEKVTNGDMIKALYPNIEEERIEDIINIYSLCEHSVTFDTEWWDNPYFAGKENESEEEE